VDRAGGDAKRLTTAVGVETDPHFSPDGAQIAFTGQYDGNTDVFLIPPRRGSPAPHMASGGGLGRRLDAERQARRVPIGP